MGALGFGGRIGRLHFLFLSLTYAAFAGAAVMTTVIATMPDARPEGPPSGMSAGTIALCALIALAFAWASLALQARRLRDIGWPPLPILLGWFVGTLLDGAVAWLVPALALPHGEGTMLGLTLNLGLAAAMLLLPGNGESDFVPVTLGSSWRPPEPAAPPPPRLALPPAPTGFGRRGL